jgi:hypothetical protein
LYLFLPAAKKGYRFNPLREPKPRSGFGFAIPQGEFGALPQTPKTKTLRVFVPLARN